MDANYSQRTRSSNKYDIASNQQVGNVTGNNQTTDSNDVIPYEENRNVAPQTVKSQPQPQQSDYFTMIPPNESRRSKLIKIAQKEDEDYQEWKERNKPGPIKLPPMSLGGDVSMAEARERQYIDLRQAPLRKQLQRNEQDRKRKEEEEEENEMRKAKQRAKARSSDYREGRKAEEQATLEAKKDEQRRKGEELEGRRGEREERERRRLAQEHRRVNNSFLDRLEGVGSGGGTGVERGGERKAGSFSAPRGDQKTPEVPAQRPGGLEPLRPPQPEPEEHLLLQAEGAGVPKTKDADYVWAVMKLQSSFPFCERAFLEDIVEQCDGDFQEAHTLLSNTLY